MWTGNQGFLFVLTATTQNIHSDSFNFECTSVLKVAIHHPLSWSTGEEDCTWKQKKWETLGKGEEGCVKDLWSLRALSVFIPSCHHFPHVCINTVTHLTHDINKQHELSFILSVDSNLSGKKPIWKKTSPSRLSRQWWLTLTQEHPAPDLPSSGRSPFLLHALIFHYQTAPSLCCSLKLSHLHPKTHTLISLPLFSHSFFFQQPLKAKPCITQVGNNAILKLPDTDKRKIKQKQIPTVH